MVLKTQNKGVAFEDVKMQTINVSKTDHGPIAKEGRYITDLINENERFVRKRRFRKRRVSNFVAITFRFRRDMVT